jgi:hypothetical protein
MKHLLAVSLLATLVSSPATALWAEQVEIAEKTKDDHLTEGKGKVTNKEITEKEIEKALIASPNVPKESHSLVVSFLDDTLPHLLADNEQLAHQLGLGDSVTNPIAIDRAFPIMLIRREDVMKLMNGAKPLSLVNNSNNWRKDNAGRLVPNRITFSLKRNSNEPEVDPHIWSSVTLEQSREGSWRIIQVGAPKLSRAMKEHETPKTNQFLLWIADLNRHYLGRVEAADFQGGDPKIFLTTLFKDRFVRVEGEDGKHIRKAGEEFDVTSNEFKFHLQRLYEKLALPKKSYSQDDEVPQPQIQQQTMPDRRNRPQPPAQAQ